MIDEITPYEATGREALEKDARKMLEIRAAVAVHEDFLLAYEGADSTLSDGDLYVQKEVFIARIRMIVHDLRLDGLFAAATKEWKK